MNEKTILQNPSITDTIVFDIKTPFAGCFNADPYKVDKIVIYFVARDFSSGNFQKYEKEEYDTSSLKKAVEAEGKACVDPTEVNIIEAKKLRLIAEDTKKTNDFFFREAEPVHVVGNENYPAWLSTDISNAFLEKVEKDENGNTIYGSFKYVWKPKEMREGDYFICWTWTPLIAGDSYSSHQRFSLSGDTQLTTSIPTHFTNPKKYTTLLSKYTPEVFKTKIANGDLSPDVIDRMNKSIALGFNTLEDLANQMVDLQDSNSLHEFLIPYLANFFGLKLKTDDPTRWRRQIKRAVPLYKRKGTKKGLAEALEHSGITLNKISQLWQVISSYSWQELFEISYLDTDKVYFDLDDSKFKFILEKTSLSLDPENFELWIRKSNETEWTELNQNYVEFNTVGGITTMSWLGDDLSVSLERPLDDITKLKDQIRVVYLYNEIPDPISQSIEEYIRTLPLIDTRDDREQAYPPKNWNVRGIAEDDVMFNSVVPNRHPFHDPIVYGKVRTEFPYSENIYNMEEYNGSIRDSLNPCDIDKNFLDPCTACISSSYDIDIEIEQVSDDKIIETKDIIRENTPFHAILHTLKFIGGFNEYIEPPQESLEILATYSGRDFVVSGHAQPYFHRLMLKVETNGILRSDLASSTSVYNGTGKAYNDEILMFCPSVVLSGVGVSSDGNAFLEIKSPSSLAGQYNVVPSDENTVSLTSPTPVEPISNIDSIFSGTNLSTSAFVFDLNNVVDIINSTLCNINQDNIYKIKDAKFDFTTLGIKTQKDVDKGTATSAWQISFAEYGTHDIIDIDSDGSILIKHNSMLPESKTTGIDYYIVQDGYIESNDGVIEVTKRGRVISLDSSSHPISEVILRKNCYQKISGTEYFITGTVSGTTDQYYIDGYDQGDMASVSIDMREKLVKEKVGYLTHKGLKLQLIGNFENSLGIQNGSSYSGGVLIENNKFKENFIVIINDMSYWIQEIEGNNPAGNTTITLSGNSQYWKTLESGGTTLNVQIYRYEKQGATIIGQKFDLPEHTFETIDRDGKSVIFSENEDGEVVLSLAEKDELNEIVSQKEEVSFEVEYKKENENE